MKRRLRVLISAYACEPHKGSEQGVGWDWSHELARQGHEVWVLTRANSQEILEKERAQTSLYPNLHFIYHDLPPLVRTLKRKLLGTRIYYLLWQYTAKRIIERVAKENDIDVYHHLTFAVDWVPSFPSKRITCRKVLGPLGGYHTSPEMRQFVQKRYVVLDGIKMLIRQIGIRFQKNEFRAYDIILSNNEWFKKEYLKVAPDRRIFCISTQITTLRAEDEEEIASNDISSSVERAILIGGRLLYWKGFDVVLQVIARLKADGKYVRATIIGDGSKRYKRHLKGKACELGISDIVSFAEGMPQKEFHQNIRKADVFLYPAFYDSGDSAMIEVIELCTPLVTFPSHGAHELLGTDYPYTSRSFSIKEISELVMTANRNCEEFRKARKEILAKHSGKRKISQLVNCYLDQWMDTGGTNQDMGVYA